MFFTAVRTLDPSGSHHVLQALGTVGVATSQNPWNMVKVFAIFLIADITVN